MNAARRKLLFWKSKRRSHPFVTIPQCGKAEGLPLGRGCKKNAKNWGFPAGSPFGYPFVKSRGLSFFAFKLLYGIIQGMKAYRSWTSTSRYTRVLNFRKAEFEALREYAQRHFVDVEGAIVNILKKELESTVGIKPVEDLRGKRRAYKFDDEKTLELVKRALEEPLRWGLRERDVRLLRLRSGLEDGRRRSLVETETILGYKRGSVAKREKTLINRLRGIEKSGHPQ